MNTKTQIPPGYMQDNAGRLVPESQVREQDKLRDQAVTELAKEALELHTRLASFKRRAVNDIADLLQIAADKYDVQLGGKKGNVSLCSYNGQYKIERVFQQRTDFNETLEVAKELFGNYLDEVTANADEDIRALIDRAFRPNSKGTIRTAELLGLIQLEIKHPLWVKAIEALKDSIVTNGSTLYIRVYQRIKDTDRYRQIPLDLASV